MKKIVAVLALVCGAMSVQAAETDLIGTYAIKEKGAMKEFFKISQDKGKFVFTEKMNNGTWRVSKEPMTTVSRAEFEKLLKHPYPAAFNGLSTKGAAVFKVSSNFQEGKFKAESGYFIVFAMGLVELHKL
jgi:hypothetical protein